MDKRAEPRPVALNFNARPNYRTNAVLILLLTGTCHFAWAEACLFSREAVRDVVAISAELDTCFSDNDRTCFISKQSLEDQAELNQLRLIPLDRLQDDGFMDRATGQVTIKFGRYNGEDSGKEFKASAQKISRCHIITSAHLLYRDGDFPLESQNFSLRYSSGQSCEVGRPFRNQDVEANVYFKMTNQIDFGCKIGDEGEKCKERLFKGHTDIVILRLKEYDKFDRSYFSLNTTDPNKHKFGQRINCWGFPEWTPKLPLSHELAEMFLWSQKNAQIFGDNDGEFVKGILTNAVGYKGMSGGGATPETPRVLVGIFSKDNKSTGIPVVNITADKKFAESDNWKSANYRSAFHVLSRRYLKERGRSLANLDDECN